MRVISECRNNSLRVASQPLILTYAVTGYLLVLLCYLCVSLDVSNMLETTVQIKCYQVPTPACLPAEFSSVTNHV